MERGLSSSPEGFWHLPSPCPLSWLCWSCSREKGGRRRGWEALGWGGGAPAPKTPGFIWEWPGAGGIWGPPSRGVTPGPKMGAGKFLVTSSPSLSSSSSSFPFPGSPQDPHPAGTLGAHPEAAAGEQPHISPLLGTPEPRAARMCPGQEEEGVGGRTGRTEPSHGRKSTKPFWGFFSKLSLFPTPFFCLFSGATSSGATTKTLSVPRVPAVLPPRSRPAELRTFSFFPIIIIIIINSNAGCKKQNQLSPPEEAPVVPPRAVSRPLCPRPSQGAAPLPRDREPRQENGWKKTKIQGKKHKNNTCQGPVPAGEGSGSPRVKNPAGSPPRMPKELQNHLKAKRPTARGRGRIFRDSDGKWDLGRGARASSKVPQKG